MDNNVSSDKKIKLLEIEKNNLLNIEIDYDAQNKARIFKSNIIFLLDNFFGKNNSFSQKISALAFDPHNLVKRGGSGKFSKVFSAQPFIKSVKEANSILDSAISNIKLQDELSESQIISEPIEKEIKKDTTKVFIVHGHDDALKDKVARFIENLNLKAIILHEQSDRGQTIISKFEANSDVGFAIVLYTPCDVGRPIKLNDQGKQYPERSRARQNVIFEHGFFAAKLGLENVVALKKGDVEFPNDLAGLIYKEYDESGAWKYKIANELEESGYKIDYKLIK